MWRHSEGGLRAVVDAKDQRIKEAVRQRCGGQEWRRGRGCRSDAVLKE